VARGIRGRIIKDLVPKSKKNPKPHGKLLRLKHKLRGVISRFFFWVFGQEEKVQDLSPAKKNATTTSLSVDIRVCGDDFMTMVWPSVGDIGELELTIFNR
jgi:hypothetical protein